MVFVDASPWMWILYLSFVICIYCERILDNKMETKVEIDVMYMYHVRDHSAPLSPLKTVPKVSHFTYIVPTLSKTMTSDQRGNNRQANNNNNNMRQGFRFANIEKGAGAFTMSTYDNEGFENTGRMKHNVVVSGTLIHVVGIPDHGSEHPTNVSSPSSSFSWSHNGCQDTLNSVQGHWVALIQSGTCNADQKLTQIMKLSNQPMGILIYGSSQVIIKQDSYLPMNQENSPMVIFLPWSNIQDVVQICYNSSGNITLPPHLRNKKNKSTFKAFPVSDQKNQCNITIKVITNSDDNFLNKTSVLFVSISFILLMVISLAWLMFYYVQRFRYIHTKEQFSRRLAHMAKKAVAKIPVKTIKHGDKETDAEIDNCAICIECYKPCDTVRILPCKHYFHKSCIDPWLLEQRSCPMCKLNILHAYGFLPNERGSLISEDRLSEVDSSLELQFMPGSTITSYPGSCTRIQTHCQAGNSYDGGTVTVQPTTTIITLPSIFTSECNSQRRWMSLRLKRPLRYPSHHIDRSVSLRHLSTGSVEERTNFLPQSGRPLSQSATNTLMDPRSLSSHWQDTSTSSSYAKVITHLPGDYPQEECSQ